MTSHVHEAKPAWLVVVNPRAGNGRAGTAAAALERHLVARGVPFQRCDTTGPGHATTLAATATAGVVAVGGDGTAHEVVNGLPLRMGRLGPFAVLPCGSGDDFASAAGFARDPATLAAHLAAPKLHGCDVGEAILHSARGGRQRRFLNHAGLGFDAEVAAAAHGHRRLRGRLLYLTATLQALRTLRPFAAARPPATAQSTTFLAIANSPRFGGGLTIAPGARLDDGCFDLVAVAGTSRLGLLVLLGKLLLGRHLADRRVHHERCNTLHVEVPTGAAAVLDGEPQPGPVTRLECRVLPRLLDCVGADFG